MTMKLKWIQVSTALSLATLSGTALADWGEQPNGAYAASSITTAPQCFPSTPNDAKKLNIYHGSWIFNRGETGTVDLTCALPWPAAYMDDSTQYFNTGLISYRDSSGSDPRSSVVIKVYQRAWSFGRYKMIRDLFTSDSNDLTYDTSVYADEPKAGENYRADKNYGPSLFLRVTMKRGNAEDILAFSSILWINPPPAYSSHIDGNPTFENEQNLFSTSTQPSL